MNRALVLSLVALFSQSGISAFAASTPYSELMSALDANTPRGLCLAKSDGCPVENSVSLKAMLTALDARATIVTLDFGLNGKVVTEKSKKVLAIVTGYQQAKVRTAGEKAIEGALKGYYDTYGPEKIRTALLQLRAVLEESIKTFTTIEAEAVQITTGRETYLRGRVGDFNAMAGKLSGVIQALAAFSGMPGAVAATLNSLPVDPRIVFDDQCGWGLLFEGASIDLTADYDFIARLTNARNLTLACKNTSDNFMGIGESSRAKYSAKNHRLTFYVGDQPSGNFSSRSAYDYTSFNEAYAELKKKF